jgi:hypothetical protein
MLRSSELCRSDLVHGQTTQEHSDTAYNHNVRPHTMLRLASNTSVGEGGMTFALPVPPFMASPTADRVPATIKEVAGTPLRVGSTTGLTARG